jgi:hypothetical protein
VNDCDTAVKELREKVFPEVQKISTIKVYALIRINETQVVSLGIYESQGAAKSSFDQLAPFFQSIVNPRVNEQPMFRGGEILAQIIRLVEA